MEQAITPLESDKVLLKTLLNNFGSLIVFIFHADWNEASTTFLDNFNKSIPVFGQYSNVRYFSVSAEKCPETFKKFSVEYTPTVIVTQTQKKILYRHQKGDIGTIFDELSTLSEQFVQDLEKERVIWYQKIDSILESCPVIIFIKGTAENPRCGFTSTLMEILRQNNVEFTFYDIVEDQYMRSWVREYKKWATYPQIFVKGELLGGLDKVKALVDNGQFLKMIPESSRQSDAQAKYQALVKENKVVAFVDGFAFENAETKVFLENIKKKHGSQVCIFNLAIDARVKEHVIANVSKKVPCLIEAGKLVSE